METISIASIAGRILEPAKIRGIESQGMLLAAGGRAEGQEFSLLTPDREVPPGTPVS
ncbi:MAG: hypothetical protein ACKVVP_01920 [Chloroflexota bacterium]